MNADPSAPMPREPKLEGRQADSNIFRSDAMATPPSGTPADADAVPRRSSDLRRGYQGCRRQAVRHEPFSTQGLGRRREGGREERARESVTVSQGAGAGGIS